MESETEQSKMSKKEEFEAIFNKESDLVYRLCLYKTSNVNIAEDLTQETFLRLWKSMEKDEQILELKSYMYQITRNLIVDYYKKKKSFSLDSLNEAGFDIPSSDTTPDVLADVGILRGVIDTLPEDYKEVIYLRFIEDMSVKEIAKILNITENLASVRINRGKEKIKEKLGYEI